jgi:aminoglycoside phosphotransferase (APT) family kinase protein
MTVDAPIDDARPPRQGEELPVDRLAEHLREKLGAHAPLEVLQFPGGHSNLTYLVRAGGAEYALRRPPFGSKVKSAHDMGREVRMLSALAKVAPWAPRPILSCDDESVIGARFYLMERRRGVVLRKEPPAGLALPPDACGALCESFVRTLVELHALDWRAIGLAEGAHPDGYLQRQVEGWTKRYADAKTDDWPAMDEVAAWLAKELPPSPPATVIHNDYKFDNLILDPADLSKIVAILDWEMATVGDPLADLGTALCYWVEAGDPPPLIHFRFGPTHLPGMMTRRELAARYAALSGRDASRIVYYFVLGLYKTAVVAQQIYYRFHQGLTKDARFEAMRVGVQLLAEQARAHLGRDAL